LKIIAIPDIHQSEHWKKTIKLINSYDKIVFLGDIFDTWTNQWPKQMGNAKEIIKFKRSNPEKVCLCWANHDTSYYLDERCSGYQPTHAIDIKEFFDENKNVFDVCFIFDSYIFSHGGVSYKWMRSAGIKEPQEINQLFKERPNFFRWVGPDGYGNNLNEGPLWIRPGALIRTAIKGYNQVVGHTESDDNPRERLSDNKDSLIFIDTGKHDKIIELDTETKKWGLLLDPKKS